MVLSGLLGSLISLNVFCVIKSNGNPKDLGQNGLMPKNVKDRYNSSIKERFCTSATIRRQSPKTVASVDRALLVSWLIYIQTNPSCTYSSNMSVNTNFSEYTQTECRPNLKIFLHYASPDMSTICCTAYNLNVRKDHRRTTSNHFSERKRSKKPH